MNKFVFRLQKVLEYKVITEDIKKQLFVESRQEYLAQKNKLDTLYNKFDKVMAGSLDNNSLPFTYICRSNYILRLKENIVDQIKKVNTCENDMNAKKSEFTESQKDRKVIEKIRENSLEEYNFNYNKFEQKQNDEFALYGFIRR